MRGAGAQQTDGRHRLTTERITEIVIQEQESSPQH
jgi:hypothetical protein